MAGSICAKNDGAMGFVVLTSRPCSLLFSAVLLAAWAAGAAALAQRAEPPLPDAAGDFYSSQQQGNRGLYEVRHWLVVDPDPEGTHCRSLEDHQPIGRLEYGDLLRTDTPEHGLQQAVVNVQGQPWLKVRIPGWRLLPGSRSPHLATCLVRANARYVAPVNGSDLQDQLRNLAR
jgi:hypothetical protein